MTPDDFDRLQVLMATRAGVRLARDRMKLAEHRLGAVARREGYASVQDLLDNLWAKPVASLGWAVIEALLNTETWFRRDRGPFVSFEHELLPAIASARPGGKVKVWSAGCSNGQEAYSLAMAALDASSRGLNVDVEVTATDLSLAAVERARAGAYTGFEIQRGLSAATMLRWFEPQDDMWAARRELREAVRFSRGNLLDEPVEGPRFDVIFCRHVLRDMEPGRRALTLDMLERRLVDDGCLFVGFDERLDSDSVAFRPVNGRRGLYVKSPAFLSRAA